MHVLLCAGLFVYGYCLYYYTARSDMSGFMQGSFFFGYMAIVCFGFFLMLGTVGWRASLMFVRHIYKVTSGFAVLYVSYLSTANQHAAVRMGKRHWFPLLRGDAVVLTLCVCMSAARYCWFRNLLPDVICG